MTTLNDLQLREKELREQLAATQATIRKMTDLPEGWSLAPPNTGIAGSVVLRGRVWREATETTEQISITVNEGYLFIEDDEGNRSVEADIAAVEAAIKVFRIQQEAKPGRKERTI
jgi:hypothetical protein